MTENFKNFIGGQWVAPATGAYFENRNPADRDDVIGCFPRSGPEDVAPPGPAAPRGAAPPRSGPAPGRRRAGRAIVGRRRPPAGSAGPAPAARARGERSTDTSSTT